MEEAKKTPEVRFKGFSDSWEHKNLEDCINRLGTGLNPRDNFKLNEGGSNYYVTIKNFEHGRLYLDDNCDKVDDNALRKIQERSDLKKDDILFTSIGRVGDCYLINEEPKNWNINESVFSIRPNKNVVNPEYLFQTLHSDNVLKQILVNVTGSTFKSIKIADLKKAIIPTPNKDEQALIGSFISNMDNLIIEQQQKYDTLCNTKKAMLQKMFPQGDSKVPEVRFKGFDGEWEQCKWIDTIDISTEMVDPTSGEYDELPHIAPGNIESFTGRILDNVKLVKDEQLISGKFRFRPDDVVYGKINPQLGKYFYANVDGLTSADAYVFNGKNGLKQKFLFSLLQTQDFFDYSVSVSKRSGMPKINRNELNAYSFLAPDENEQEAIGEYLLSLDNLTALNRRKLEKLKNIKSAMLEKMFV